MAAKPQEHARFTVASGCLCYGSLHTMFHGASQPIQPFIPPPVQTPHQIGGTVMVQTYIHNTSAQNGTWIAYQLIDLERGGVVSAWFACHADVDPEVEIDKILRVSGSPYEMDSGSQWNNEKTSREGVLVFNRYDWIIQCGKEEEERFEEVPDELEDSQFRDVGQYNSLGIVDYGHAEKQIAEWKGKIANERVQPEHGAWFYIPNGEYMFARFGFDDAHSAARSFLFFTTNTYFDQTTFRGLSKSLRLKETPEESFERKLREGCKYEGFDMLNKVVGSTMEMQQIYPPRWDIFEGRPVESECLGPYNKNLHILKEADFEAIRVAAETLEIPGPLKWPVFDLLNEMILSYLEQFVIPASSEDSSFAAAATLCPKPGTTKDETYHRNWVKTYMVEPYKDPIPGFDFDAVGSRIKDFLRPRCGNSSLVNNNGFSIGIASIVRYLVAELLKDASPVSRDNNRKITPSDIRLGTHFDQEFRSMFRLCRLYWYRYSKP
ncbi:hypothetical protein ACEPPN_001089 [Leptodophora sp. 'Broadleaf-Isolate-01']